MKPERRPAALERLLSEWKTARLRNGSLPAGLVDRERRLERRRPAASLGVDLGIAFIDRQHGVVLAAEAQQVLQIVVCWRSRPADWPASRDRPRPSAATSPRRCSSIVGQEAVRLRRIDQQRLGARQHRAAEIGLIERIGQRDDRLAAALLLRRRHRGDDVDAFLAARRRMHVLRRIEQALRQPVAPRRAIRTIARLSSGRPWLGG